MPIRMNGITYNYTQHDVECFVRALRRIELAITNDMPYVEQSRTEIVITPTRDGGEQ